MTSENRMTTSGPEIEWHSTDPFSADGEWHCSGCGDVVELEEQRHTWQKCHALLKERNEKLDSEWWGVLGQFGDIFPSLATPSEVARAAAETISELSAALDALAPIGMILHCPRCHAQHIDAPEPLTGWENPPHRSHKCSACGCVWRPADVPTTGVAAIETHGTVDTWPLRPARGHS